MPRIAKVDWYLAVPHNEYTDVRPRMWDMLRYDQCFPLHEQTYYAENTGHRWWIIVQPWRQNVRSGFTQGRWESFGFRTAVAAAEQARDSLCEPPAMRAYLDAFNPPTTPHWIFL